MICHLLWSETTQEKIHFVQYFTANIIAAAQQEKTFHPDIKHYKLLQCPLPDLPGRA